MTVQQVRNDSSSGEDISEEHKTYKAENFVWQKIGRVDRVVMCGFTKPGLPETVQRFEPFTLRKVCDE